jgi:general secretion pathway protein I
MSSHRAGAGSAGFTLIEILVALAILALTFGFAFQAFSGGFEWLDRNRRNADAVLLAQSMLTRVGHDVALEERIITGRTPDGLSWRIEATPYGDTADMPPGRLIGYRVEVRIGWIERDQERQLRLTTLRLAPKGQSP